MCTNRPGTHQGKMHVSCGAFLRRPRQRRGLPCRLTCRSRSAPWLQGPPWRPVLQEPALLPGRTEMIVKVCPPPTPARHRVHMNKASGPGPGPAPVVSETGSCRAVGGLGGWAGAPARCSRLLMAARDGCAMHAARHPAQLGPTSLAGLALPPARGRLRAVTQPWPPTDILPPVGRSLFFHSMHLFKKG